MYGNISSLRPWVAWVMKAFRSSAVSKTTTPPKQMGWNSDPTQRHTDTHRPIVCVYFPNFCFTFSHLNTSAVWAAVMNMNWNLYVSVNNVTHLQPFFLRGQHFRLKRKLINSAGKRNETLLRRRATNEWARARLGGTQMFSQTNFLFHLNTVWSFHPDTSI